MYWNRLFPDKPVYWISTLKLVPFYTRAMISLLMPNYNYGEYLSEALQSVIDQTFQDWELIVVDDASTDRSVGVINSFTSDKRIKLFRKQENGGYGNAHRTAISHATRPIIGILDTDDTLRGEALQVMVDAHAEHDAGFIYSQHDVCDVELKPVRGGSCQPLPPGTTYFDAVQKDTTAECISHFKTFKRTAYDQTDGFTSWRRTVDKDIVLKLEEVTTLKFIDLSLYLYREHPKGISRDPTTHSFRKEAIAAAVARRGL